MPRASQTAAKIGKRSLERTAHPGIASVPKALCPRQRRRRAARAVIHRVGSWPYMSDERAPSVSEARFNVFAFEVCGAPSKPRWLDVLESVHVDDRIEVARDLAGNYRHRAATRADVKRGRASTEGVLRQDRGIANIDSERGSWIGGPDATVLGAERATARASRYLGRLAFPVKLEGDIAAVALAGDKHTNLRGNRRLTAGYAGAFLRYTLR